MKESKIKHNLQTVPGHKGIAYRVKDNPMLSRRDFLKLAGLFTGGTLLNACAPSINAPSPETPSEVQLVYQDWRTEWFPLMAQQMLEQFHSTHPNIRVFYVPDPVDVEESLLEDMKAGVAPDVFAACCSFFPILAQEDQTLDLRPFIESELDEQTIQDWDPVQFQALQKRTGEQYGLPKYHGALALYYNKDLFDEYRVDYPDGSWDHDDYLEAMKLLTHDRDADGRLDLWGSILDLSWDRIQVHVNAWGGHFVDPDDPSRSLMGEQPALDAMEWLRARMWDDRVMARPLDVQNIGTQQAFISGKVAMAEDGSWALKNILSNADFRIGIAPLPSGPEQRVTLSTTDGFGVYRGTLYPQASRDLLRFLISKDYGRAMAKANFLQPARASLVQDWVEFIQREFPEKTKDMDIAVFAEGHLQGYSVVAEIFRDMVEAKNLVYSAWDQIFLLGEQPVDLMKEVSKQVEETQQVSQ
jgi:multiple sugar transport system substrate-binding protein